MSHSPTPSRTLSALRSLLFTLVFFAWTVVFCFVMVASFLVPLIWRYQIVRVYITGTLLSLKYICGLTYRTQGLENVPTEPSIIFSKHQSTFENFVLIDALPNSAYIAKRELLYVPFFGWGMAALKYITIDRAKGKKAIQQIIDQAKVRFAMGLWVTIYPEGTRLKPGEKVEYKAGGALLAAATGRKIVMVAHNSGEFWPRRSFLKWPGTVDFVFSPPYASEGKSASTIRTETQAWMENASDRIHVPNRFPS
ncbi:MAG: lysophospholipid acyltransferase family protein [Pseudomonadota bacterium]